MKFTQILIAIIVTSLKLQAEGEPQEFTTLRDSYQRALDRAVSPIQETYIAELRKLKTKYTKDDKLADAILIDKEITRFLDAKKKNDLSGASVSPPIKFEGEDLKNMKASGGAAQQQPMGSFGKQWSGDRQLWWASAKPGDNLTIKLSVEKPGQYKVQAQFTKAADYGTFDLYINGRKIKDSIDCYNTIVDVTGVIDLGLHDLVAGDNELKVVIVGANQLAIKNYMFGLDYIELIKQD